MTTTTTKLKAQLTRATKIVDPREFFSQRLEDLLKRYVAVKAAYAQRTYRLVDGRKGVMWQRQCPCCKRELRKRHLWEILVCLCGWQWGE
jgi:hypothetical protein